MISSVLTALGVPGGTAASTFDDAYLDELSKSANQIYILKINTFNSTELSELRRNKCENVRGECERDELTAAAGDCERA